MENTLVKYLVRSFYISRRKAAIAIKAGKVTVNGRIAENFTMLINENDSIIYDGICKEVKLQTKNLTLIMNKPKGILSATTDKREKTVLDILPAKYKKIGLFPAGRLDKDSTGLVILTNDGDLAYKLTHPSFEHEKEYYVATATNLSTKEQKQLQDGVDIYGGHTAPAKIRALNKTMVPYNYSIIIHEGKKRQIRRMFSVVNNNVLELKRVRIGNFVLPKDLAEGHVREI